MNRLHLELCSSAEWAEMVQRHVIPWVLDGIELGDDALEIGPGPGRTTEVLRGMTPRLTALELDDGLASALRARLPDVDVIDGDATMLPFEDGRFSAVLSFTMLHHVPTVELQDAVFREAARVVRPGGAFVGTDSLDSPEFRDLHVDDTCVPVDPATLEARLLAAGFATAQVDTNEYALRFRARPGD